jgi:hypothetical protein
MSWYRKVFRGYSILKSFLVKEKKIYQELFAFFNFYYSIEVRAKENFLLIFKFIFLI